jgi:hypothetical protein
MDWVRLAPETPFWIPCPVTLICPATARLGRALRHKAGGGPLGYASLIQLTTAFGDFVRGLELVVKC